MGDKGAKGASETEEIVKWILAELSSVGEVSTKKMFGGYGLFESEAMFGMVTAKGILCLKADDSNRVQYEKAGSKRMGKMPYYPVPDAVQTNRAILREWAKQSIALAREAKKKKKKKKK